MAARLFCFAIVTLAGLVLLAACGGDSPVAPVLEPQGSLETHRGGQNPHHMIACGWIRHDTAADSLLLIPARGPSSHWNALYLMEQWPCTDCVRIENISKLANGEWLFDLVLKHPCKEEKLGFTAFDVRAILMFSATGEFPALHVSWPDPTQPGGTLLNPNGYTTLYNPSWFPEEALHGYFAGAYSTSVPPSSTLNPYKDFSPVSERRHLIPGAEARAAMHIVLHMPGDRLGYAIDASWAPPVVDPPISIPDDFGLSSNIPEPFALLIDPVINTLHYQNPSVCGGELQLAVKVYDWQGGQPSTEGGTLNAIHFDCPSMFAELNAEPLDWYSGWDCLPYVLYRFRFNPIPPWPGTFPLLVAAEDIEPGILPDTKATAYQVAWIDVAGEPVNLAPVADAAASSPKSGPAPLTVKLDPSNSYDPDGSLVLFEWDVDNDGQYELVSAIPDPVGWVFADPGKYPVYLRVTDDMGLASIGHIFVNVGPPLNQPPVADLSLSGPATGPAPLDVTLDGSLSYDPDGSIVLWEWDVDGDGEYEFLLGSASPLVYTYEEPDDTTLVLRVTDDEDAQDTDEMIIQVK